MELKKALELRINYGIEDFIRVDKNGYVCLTDMIKYFPHKNIKKWLKNKTTKEFITVIESFLNGPNCPHLKKVLITKRGRFGGGTYAHIDLAMEFAMWLSPEFKLKVIQSYRLGTQRQKDWDIKRILAAQNYKLQCEAIHNSDENEKMNGFAYSNNAIMLNKIIFGKHERNIRDNATEKQLEDISYLQSRNGALIEFGIEYEERKEILKTLYKKRNNIKKIT